MLKFSVRFLINLIKLFLMARGVVGWINFVAFLVVDNLEFEHGLLLIFGI